MPSSSPAQARLFAAVAHNKAFAAKVGIPQSVGREFNRADAGTGILRRREEGGPVGFPDSAASPNLLDQAKQQYPILKDHDIDYTETPKSGEGYLEFWPAGEPGTTDRPRPGSLSQTKPGVEVFRRDTRPIDIVGDIASHHLVNTDPTIKQHYQEFQRSLTPGQNKILESQYSYAKQNHGEARSFDDWKATSGLPAYFRGYAFDQWPKEEANILYTPEQIGRFDKMLDYLKGGQQEQQHVPKRAEGGSVYNNWFGGGGPMSGGFQGTHPGMQWPQFGGGGSPFGGFGAGMAGAAGGGSPYGGLGSLFQAQSQLAPYMARLLPPQAQQAYQGIMSKYLGGGQQQPGNNGVMGPGGLPQQSMPSQGNPAQQPTGPQNYMPPDAQQMQQPAGDAAPPSAPQNYMPPQQPTGPQNYMPPQQSMPSQGNPAQQPTGPQSYMPPQPPTGPMNYLPPQQSFGGAGISTPDGSQSSVGSAPSNSQYSLVGMSGGLGGTSFGGQGLLGGQGSGTGQGPKPSGSFAEGGVARISRSIFDDPEVQKVLARAELAAQMGAHDPLHRRYQPTMHSQMEQVRQIDNAVPRGVAPVYAAGGAAPTAPWYERGAMYRLNRGTGGMLKSAVPGRTDKLNLNVGSGSYVLPADTVSGLGQGNSAAGGKVLDRMFSKGPRGTNLALKGRARAGRMFMADGGAAERDVPILAAGGEYVVEPEHVARLGRGSMRKGHEVLDQFVKNVRSKHVKTLRTLPPPKKR